MFSIVLAEVLVFQPLNIIINNLNIVFYNYINTRLITITFLLSASLHYVSFA
jgi:hypothetical protein